MVVSIAVTAACPKSRPSSGPTATATATATPSASKVKLAVLAVESVKFPALAEAATVSLAKAQVSGVDEVEVSKVSLEVVQLSIECVDASLDCYAAVGKSLAADRLLFAQVAPTGKRKRDVQITVTLFDVDTHTPHTAQKTFTSEREATAGIDTLITEATQQP